MVSWQPNNVRNRAPDFCPRHHPYNWAQPCPTSMASTAAGQARAIPETAAFFHRSAGVQIKQHGGTRSSARNCSPVPAVEIAQSWFAGTKRNPRSPFRSTTSRRRFNRLAAYGYAR